MSTRLKALVVLGAGAMLITACSEQRPRRRPRPPRRRPAHRGSREPASRTKIKVTLLTKATGGFWDAMIAGAKQYETDHPNDIELTTNACKTNDDTPCQIARDPGRCHQGRPGDRDLPDGRWRHRCPQ